jgi:hypothetical protein
MRRRLFAKNAKKYSLENAIFLSDEVSRLEPLKSEDLVEVLRELVEVVVWGDKHEEEIFDLFLERNMLGTFASMFCDAENPVPTRVQVVQCVTILFQNLTRQQSVYFLLSNDRINRMINANFDFNDEEMISNYVSFIKTLSLRLTAESIQFFFTMDSFPLFLAAVRLLPHDDRMVRTSARSIIMNVLQIECSQAISHFLLREMPYAFDLLLGFVANHLVKIDGQIRFLRTLQPPQPSAGPAPSSLASIDTALEDLVDDLYYFNDLCGIPNRTIVGFLIKQLEDFASDVLLAVHTPKTAVVHEAAADGAKEVAQAPSQQHPGPTATAPPTEKAAGGVERGDREHPEGHSHPADEGKSSFTPQWPSPEECSPVVPEQKPHESELSHCNDGEAAAVPRTSLRPRTSELEDEPVDADAHPLHVPAAPAVTTANATTLPATSTPAALAESVQREPTAASPSPQRPSTSSSVRRTDPTTFKEMMSREKLSGTHLGLSENANSTGGGSGGILNLSTPLKLVMLSNWVRVNTVPELHDFLLHRISGGLFPLPSADSASESPSLSSKEGGAEANPATSHHHVPSLLVRGLRSDDLSLHAVSLNLYFAIHKSKTTTAEQRRVFFGPLPTPSEEAVQAAASAETKMELSPTLAGLAAAESRTSGESGKEEDALRTLLNPQHSGHLIADAVVSCLCTQLLVFPLWSRFGTLTLALNAVSILPLPATAIRKVLTTAARIVQQHLQRKQIASSSWTEEEWKGASPRGGSVATAAAGPASGSASRAASPSRDQSLSLKVDPGSLSSSMGVWSELIFGAPERELLSSDEIAFALLDSANTKWATLNKSMNVDKVGREVSGLMIAMPATASAIRAKKLLGLGSDLLGASPTDPTAALRQDLKSRRLEIIKASAPPLCSTDAPLSASTDPSSSKAASPNPLPESLTTPIASPSTTSAWEALYETRWKRYFANIPLHNRGPNSIVEEEQLEWMALLLTRTKLYAFSASSSKPDGATAGSGSGAGTVSNRVALSDPLSQHLESLQRKYKTDTVVNVADLKGFRAEGLRLRREVLNPLPGGSNAKQSGGPSGGTGSVDSVNCSPVRVGTPASSPAAFEAMTERSAAELGLTAIDGTRCEYAPAPTDALPTPAIGTVMYLYLEGAELLLIQPDRSAIGKGSVQFSFPLLYTEAMTHYRQFFRLTLQQHKALTATTASSLAKPSFLTATPVAASPHSPSNPTLPMMASPAGSPSPASSSSAVELKVGISLRDRRQCQSVAKAIHEHGRVLRGSAMSLVNQYLAPIQVQ